MREAKEGSEESEEEEEERIWKEEKEVDRSKTLPSLPARSRAEQRTRFPRSALHGVSNSPATLG